MESFARRTVRGFLISVGVSAAPLVPVMVFTFIGLSGSPDVREMSVLFADFIRTYGLGLGLVLSFLSNLLTAALILALTHLVFYRPAVFQDPEHLAFARKLVAAGIGLFLLVWGQKFFLDGYNDMMVLEAAGLGSSAGLSVVLFAGLFFFFGGVAYWLATLFPRVKLTGGGQSGQNYHAGNAAAV